MAQRGAATSTAEQSLRRALGHRPGLDGLRGIAILFVMLDHAGVGFATGAGAVGVTVFFVLSGFLITSLLLEEHAANGRVSLRRFYWRRALRLLPALVVFLFAVAFVMLLAGRADEIAGDIGPTLFYFMNWATVAGNNPGLLSHTWSLSIEEQFYLVWPVVLLGTLVIGRGRLAWTTALLVTLSVLAVLLRAFVWSAPDAYHRAYFGTDTRMDALAVGCLVAVAFRRWEPRVRPLAMVALGASLPIIVWATNDASMATIGLAAAAVAAAGLTAGSASGFGSTVLGWRPLAYLGVVSYGLYLWHRPVMKAFTDAGLGGLPWAVAIMLTLSVGLAIGSRRWVEEPFLRLKDRYFASGSRASATRGRSARPTSRNPIS